MNNNVVKAVSFNGNYYGWGDSIMRATKPGSDLSGDGSDCYVLYMQDTYDNGNTSDHNMDGGGKTTHWGLANFSRNITNMGWYVIEAFGANDIYYDGGLDSDGYTCSPQSCAGNKLDMYNFSVENNSESHYLPIVWTLAQDGVDRPRSTQLQYINTTINFLNNYSIRYVKLFDAIDTVPYNGQIDGWDSDYYFDTVHPNKTGHIAMGDFLWYFINHSDYSTQYHSGNNTVTINANYNETIFINNSYYNFTSPTILCLTNSTIITNTIQTAINGSNMIRFDIVKDSNYLIFDYNISFISINNQGNNSIVANGRRYFNWTKIDSATKYQLQISNSTDFSTTFFNASNITEGCGFESMPGGNYTEKGNYVEFYLPYAYNISWYGSHYYRVRGYYI